MGGTLNTNQANHTSYNKLRKLSLVSNQSVSRTRQNQQTTDPKVAKPERQSAKAHFESIVNDPAAAQQQNPYGQRNFVNLPRTQEG